MKKLTEECPLCFGSGQIMPGDVYRAERAEQRRRIGMTQEQFAHQLAISKAYLCDLEQGRRRWTLDLRRKADEILGKEPIR